MKAASCWFALCTRKPSPPQTAQGEDTDPTKASSGLSSGRGVLSRGTSLSSRKDSLLDRLQSLRITIREEQIKRASDLAAIRSSTIAEESNEAEAAAELQWGSC